MERSLHSSNFVEEVSVCVGVNDEHLINTAHAILRQLSRYLLMFTLTAIL